MLIFDTFRALLPRARAWTLNKDRMVVRWLKGLMPPLHYAREYADRMWRDAVDPQVTRFLPDWENQFALNAGELTNQQRRNRLDAVWKSTGGQDPAYITRTLQAHGFPVFTHPWWTIAPHGVPDPRDPRDYLLPEFGGTDTDGFLLASQYYTSGKVGPFAEAMEPIMQAGEPNAQAGYFGGFVSELVDAFYCGPTETYPDGSVYDTHPYYVYIGGETFPDTVDIPANRREEFERLVLSLCPGHLWKVLRVRYV